MTDDNWQSTKLAIGFINGVYSVNAEVIAGTLIAGNQLTISNESNSFVVDSNGVRIDNASMTITTPNNQIIINPDVGIKLQKKNGDNLEDKLYFSSEGDLNFSGTLTAADGIFSGTVEAGTINASNIYGSYIEGGEIYGSTIEGGSVSGSTIYFGSGKSGATLKGSGSDGATLTCSNGIFNIVAKPSGGTPLPAYVNIEGNIVLGEMNSSFPNIDMEAPGQATGYLIANGGYSSEDGNYSIYALHGINSYERIKTRTYLEAEYGIVLRTDTITSWSDIQNYIDGNSDEWYWWSPASGYAYAVRFRNGILVSYSRAPEYDFDPNAVGGGTTTE